MEVSINQTPAISGVVKIVEEGLDLDLLIEGKEYKLILSMADWNEWADDGHCAKAVSIDLEPDGIDGIILLHCIAGAVSYIYLDTLIRAVKEIVDGVPPVEVAPPTPFIPIYNLSAHEWHTSKFKMECDTVRISIPTVDIFRIGWSVERFEDDRVVSGLIFVKDTSIINGFKSKFIGDDVLIEFFANEDKVGEALLGLAAFDLESRVAVIKID